MPAARTSTWKRSKARRQGSHPSRWERSTSVWRDVPLARSTRRPGEGWLTYLTAIFGTASRGAGGGGGGGGGATFGGRRIRCGYLRSALRTTSEISAYRP